jgi:CheY-like chemotaxis protein
MPNKVLQVEDNPDDVTLTALAFRKAGVQVQMDVATDGDEAIAALQRCQMDGLPAIVLLDIKLPTKSGLDVLAWIRSQSRLKRLPVVMLTSSLLPKDINDAYDLGANSYLVKPTNLETMVSLAQAVSHYWLRVNTSPTY